MLSVTISGATSAQLKQNILSMAGLLEDQLRVVENPNQATFEELETTSNIDISQLKKEISEETHTTTSTRKPRKSKGSSVGAAVTAETGINQVASSPVLQAAPTDVLPTYEAQVAAGTAPAKKSEGASAPSTASADPFGVTAPVVSVPQKFNRDDLTKTINAFLEHENGGMDKAVGIFASFGAKKMSDIPDGKIDAVISTLNVTIIGAGSAQSAPNLLS